MHLGEIQDRVREKNPLVHHITNYVTVNDCANACLAAGASPVMADSPEEAADMAGISSSLVLNIGTLNREKVKAMLLAGRKANAKGIPVVLDPVGCGAAPFRNRMAAELLQEIRFSVIRGNASEISSLAGNAAAHTRGVDSGKQKESESLQAARLLSSASGAVTVISGETDIITDGERVCLVRNGSDLMPRITGSGCMCSSLIGAFCGACPSSCYESTVAAMAAMGLAGEMAEAQEGRSRLGHFHMALFDALGRMDGRMLEKGARYEEI